MQKHTNDEGEIRRWATRHNAHPIERAPFHPDGVPAQLGFVFGDRPVANESLQPIEWSRFFAIFHMVGLVLAYGLSSDYELLKVEGNTPARFEGKPMQA